jgi:ribonuclease R
MSKRKRKGKYARKPQFKKAGHDRTQSKTLHGKLLVHRNGKATFVTKQGDNEVAYRIHERDTGTAMHMDKVEVTATTRQPSPKKGYPRRNNDREPRVKVKVQKVLERARDRLAGTVYFDGSRFFVVPDNPRIPLNINVDKEQFKLISPTPKIQDKVLLSLDEWKDPSRNPSGKVIEVLGKSHTPMAEYKAILREYNLEPEFPEAVMKQTQDTPDKVSKDELANRVDVRNLLTLTIDPVDAKDFDDALSVEHLGEGKVRIGVHIADVSHYVQAGTPLDAEAHHRGNSTYLVGTVIPMLPHPLSSGICSLVEGEDRLVKTVYLTFEGAQLTATKIENSVICSNKRLSYPQALALLKNGDPEYIRGIPSPPAHQTGFPGRPLSGLSDKEIQELHEAVNLLWDIASKLRDSRMKAGSLDLDMPETKIYVDEEGWADRIEKIEHDESHQLIEEFMLLANEQIAKYLRMKNIPGIFRVHDDPDPEKLNDLRGTLKDWDIDVGDLSNKAEMAKALEEIRKHPQAHMLRVEVLRSLPKAVYRATPDGHYGLSKADYLHFTSPIRRYADLVVHRVIGNHIEYREGRTNKAEPANLRKGSLESTAHHLSLTERNSTDAERESQTIKLLEYFEKELEKEPKTDFEAVIMDIARYGTFVELTHSGAYGMLLGLRGHTGRVWGNGKGKPTTHNAGQELEVGYKIQVQVESVDRFLRQLNFTPSK